LASADEVGSLAGNAWIEIVPVRSELFADLIVQNLGRLEEASRNADRGGDASFDEKHHKVEIQNIDLES
jgi:hypothetical protein